MANNPQALTLVKLVAETPGFMMETLDDGAYKLTRLAIPEHDITAETAKVSPRAHDRQFNNAITRLRRMGWTQELHDKLMDLSRQHRIDGTPTEDARKAELEMLLEAFGADPDARPDGEEKKPKPVVRRHGKGGTATGSATPKAMAKKARTAQVVTISPGQEAPVELIPTGARVQAEIISPERALDLLVKMAPYQRKLKDQKVRDYTAAMRRGEWTLNPADPICIDTNDQTANGQHRLHAVVECEQPQPFYVAYGVDPETYKVMDRGTKRTTGDMLHGAGEVSATNLAATAKLAHQWFNIEEQTEWKSSPEVTEAQVFAVLDAHPNLRESVRLGRIPGGMKCSPTGSMFAHYLISRKCGGDTRLVTRWYQAIGEMDLDRGQPGHTLGLYFLKSSPSATRRTALAGRTKRELDMYLIIQAWNNTCQGKEQRSISWKPDFVIARPVAPGPNAAFPPVD